jgi:hypothetical protein
MYQKIKPSLRTLAKAWQRSVMLFAPQQWPFFGVTVLGWLKNLKKFWWFFILLGCAGWLAHYLVLWPKSFYFGEFKILNTWGMVSLLHSIGMLYLTGFIRPSVRQKNIAYTSQLFLYLPLFMLLCMVSFVLTFVSVSSWLLVPLNGFIGAVGFSLWPLSWWYSSPLIIFFTLLLLDKVKGFWWRAFLMTWYDYPVCLIVVMLLGLISRGMMYLGTLHYAADVILTIMLYALIVPLFVQFFVNLYSKRVHENYEDYFS